MKKHILAYTRTYLNNEGKSKGSNKDNSEDSLRLDSNEHKSPSNSIYQAIMGQMAVNHSDYINKMITKQERGQKNQTNSDKNASMNTHQRTKSYTNIVVDNMGKHSNRNSIKQEQKRFENGKTAKNMVFYSHKNSPKTNKTLHSSKEKERKQRILHPFLENLDSYIIALKYEKIDGEERRTVSKSKENNSYFQIIKKLQGSQKKLKQLKLSNHILKIQQTKQRKKNKELKEKLHEMLDHMRSLTNDLERQRFQRKKIQSFFKQFQHKFSLVCRQRKTIPYKSSKREFFEENTTEQDEQLFDMILTKQFFQSKSKSSRKNSNSKTNKYQIHSIREFNEENSDHLFVPTRNFEDSDSSTYK